MKSLKFAGVAIACVSGMICLSIAGFIVRPRKELISISFYDFDSGEKQFGFVSNRRPFLLSGTTLLWCNGKLETFPSVGTVITLNASRSDMEAGVTICQKDFI